MFPSVGWHVVKSHLCTEGKCLSKGVGQDMGRGRLFTPIFTVGTGRGERGEVWLGDWGGDVTPRYIRLSFSVSAVSPLMNNTNVTNYTKIGDNSSYHH